MSKRRVLVVARSPVDAAELEAALGVESEIRLVAAGNVDPLPRIASELRDFDADEIMLLPTPVGSAFVDRACERFGLPVFHFPLANEADLSAAA
jgi:hypothetical protein